MNVVLNKQGSALLCCGLLVQPSLSIVQLNQLERLIRSLKVREKRVRGRTREERGRKKSEWWGWERFTWLNHLNNLPPSLPSSLCIPYMLLVNAILFILSYWMVILSGQLNGIFYVGTVELLKYLCSRIKKPEIHTSPHLSPSALKIPSVSGHVTERWCNLMSCREGSLVAGGAFSKNKVVMVKAKLTELPVEWVTCTCMSPWFYLHDFTSLLPLPQ